MVDLWTMPSDQLAAASIKYTTTLKLEPSAERSDIFRYEWYKEGSSVVIGTNDELSFTNADLASVVYCKIYSVYNGDESIPFETVHFTVV